MSPPYHLTTLRNGLGLAVRPMPQAQSVSVGLWVRAGGRYESAAVAGISHFVEHLVFKGTRRYSCEALKQAVEGVGGSLNGFTAEEFTCYMAKVPGRYARRAIGVLAELARRPLLRPADLEKERGVILEEIRMYEDTPGQYVHDLFSQLLWPDHPLGALLSGTADTVRRISHQDLVAYWKWMYQPRAMLLACVGACEPEGVAREAEKLFGTMRATAVRRFLRAPRRRRGPQVRVWRKPTEQTHLCAGAYAVPRTHPDRFALELLHVLLGGNMSSRLFREVREKRGLVYEIGTAIKRFQDTGAFVIFAGCETAKVTETVQRIFRELARIRRHPLAKAELRRAKEYYAGQLTTGLEDTMDHMLWMGEQAVTVGRVRSPDALLGYVDRVTARDVRRIARRIFFTENMHLALVGPESSPSVSQLGALCRVG